MNRSIPSDWANSKNPRLSRKLPKLDDNAETHSLLVLSYRGTVTQATFRHDDETVTDALARILARWHSTQIVDPSVFVEIGRYRPAIKSHYGELIHMSHRDEQPVEHFEQHVMWAKIQ